MNILNRIFKKAPTLLSELDFSNTNDSHRSIIELDDRIGKLCSYGENIDVLNDCQRNFFLNQSFEKELNNGGFHQFFFNSTGKYSHETIGSLKAINAINTVMLLEAAISKFPDGQVSFRS